MILVDTSAWIDFFAGRSCPHVAALESLVNQSRDLCTCGLVLAEVLQGISSQRQYREVQEHFDNLLYLPMTRDTFVASAHIYRSLRRRGITIRKPMDCMISATALEHDVRLLHNDRDFQFVADHCGLRTVLTEQK